MIWYAVWILQGITSRDNLTLVYDTVELSPFANGVSGEQLPPFTDYPLFSMNDML